MRVTKTLMITATGVLTVTVTPSPSRGYAGITEFTFDINWTVDTAPGGEANIEIDYGDGTIETFVDLPPARAWHTYASPGTYTVTVTVFDREHAVEGVGTATVEVAAALTVSFSADKTTGPVPLAVTFSCEARGGFLPYSWTLDPGDGSAPYSGTRTTEGVWTVSHTYVTVGTFTATLTVTDALGASLSMKIAMSPGVVLEIPWLHIAMPFLAGASALLVSRM